MWVEAVVGEGVGLLPVLSIRVFLKYLFCQLRCPINTNRYFQCISCLPGNSLFRWANLVLPPLLLVEEVEVEVRVGDEVLLPSLSLVLVLLLPPSRIFEA